MASVFVSSCPRFHFPSLFSSGVLSGTKPGYTEPSYLYLFCFQEMMHLLVRAPTKAESLHSSWSPTLQTRSLFLVCQRLDGQMLLVRATNSLIWMYPRCLAEISNEEPDDRSTGLNSYHLPEFCKTIRDAMDVLVYAL